MPDCSGDGGYTIELLVNGVVQPEATVHRSHIAGTPEKVTLSGSTTKILNKGDLIQLRIKSLKPGVLSYLVDPSGTNLKVARKRAW